MIDAARHIPLVSLSCDALESGRRARRAALSVFIGRQRFFAGSFARASRTAPEPVRTPKMPLSTVTM